MRKGPGLNTQDSGGRKADPVDALVGERLKYFRTAKKVSQSQLAQAVGLSLQQIQKYEYGSNRMAVSTLVKLARALDVPPEELVANLEAPRDMPRGEGVGSEPVRLVNAFARIASAHQRRLALEIVEELAMAVPKAARSAG